MATITIKGVPEKIVNKIGTSIEYTSDLQFPSRKRLADNETKIVYWDETEAGELWKVSTITSKSF